MSICLAKFSNCADKFVICADVWSVSTVNGIAFCIALIVACLDSSTDSLTVSVPCCTCFITALNDLSLTVFVKSLPIDMLADSCHLLVSFWLCSACDAAFVSSTVSFCSLSAVC